MKKYLVRIAQRKPSLQTFLKILFVLLIVITVASFFSCASYSMCGARVNSLFHNVANVSAKGKNGECSFELGETGIDSTPGTSIVSKALDKIPNAPVAP